MSPSQKQQAKSLVLYRFSPQASAKQHLAGQAPNIYGGITVGYFPSVFRSPPPPPQVRQMVRHPRGRYIVIPIAVSGVTTPENEVKLIGALALSSISKKVDTRCRSPSYERFLEGCSSPFMGLVEHLTALRIWCKKWLPGW